MDPRDVYFHEEQHRPFGWAMIIGVLMAGYTWAVTAPQHLARIHEHGLHVADVLPLLFLALMGVWLPLYGIAARYTVRLEGGILNLHMRFGGSKTIDVREIRKVRVTSYYPVVDGAWGLRKGQALRLFFDEDREVRVGTSKPAELKAAIEAARAA